PGAGYSNSTSSRGNPPKSWIVRGASMAVTRVPGTYQWAETARIAFGRGRECAIRDQAFVYPLTSIALIGFPRPTKTGGRLPFAPRPSRSSAILFGTVRVYPRCNTTRMKKFLLFAGALFAVSASSVASKVTVDDLMKLRSIMDVRISPDGGEVAYVV